MSLAVRRLAVVLVTVGGLALGGGWAPTPADATSYRFWSYWSGGSDWTFASQGASRRPADGAVEGWRFAVSAASTSSSPPRHASSFAKICGTTAPVDGKKRIGLVLDPGTTGDAPPGESPPAMLVTCVVVAGDANGYEVLAAAGAQLRTDSGLICGINGYPATECGVSVADPEPPDHGGSGDGGGGGEDRPSNPGGAGGAPVSDDGGPVAATDGDEVDSRDDDRKGKAPAADGAGKDDASKDGSSAPSDAPSEMAAAAQVTEPTAATSSGSPLGVLVGLIAVGALGLTAWALRRRRS